MAKPLLLLRLNNHQSRSRCHIVSHDVTMRCHIVIGWCEVKIANLRKNNQSCRLCLTVWRCDVASSRLRSALEKNLKGFVKSCMLKCYTFEFDTRELFGGLNSAPWRSVGMLSWQDESYKTSASFPTLQGPQFGVVRVTWQKNLRKIIKKQNMWKL